MHGPHHVAQKSSTTTLPRSSESFTALPSSVCETKSGAVAPIFEEWLKPWHDVGATIVTQRNTGSTDHVSFDAVGIPGFQFVQDQLDYFSHVHHTHLDVQDHAVADDLKQASAIVASFVYNTAQRPGKLPRKMMVED